MSPIVDGKTHHAKRDRVKGIQTKALAQVRLNHPVIEQTGKRIGASEGGELALVVVQWLSGHKLVENLDRALNGVVLISQHEGMKAHGDIVTSLASQGSGRNYGTALAQGFKERDRSAKQRVSARVDVLQEFFFAKPAENVLPEIAGHLLRPGIPKNDPTFAIYSEDSNGKGFENLAVQVLVQAFHDGSTQRNP